jgi:hypothetical protein
VLYTVVLAWVAVPEDLCCLSYMFEGAVSLTVPSSSSSLGTRKPATEAFAVYSTALKAVSCMFCVFWTQVTERIGASVAVCLFAQSWLLLAVLASP